MRYYLALTCLIWLSHLVAFPFEHAYSQAPNLTSQNQTKTSKVGVLAFRGVDVTLSNWQPLARYLSDSIPGWQFKLVPVTLGSASHEIENERIDFLITNPGHYVTLAERFGLSALATRERPSRNSDRNLLEYGSVIFVKKQSKISALNELKDRTIAAVSPDAFGGFQIAWNELQAQGIDAFTDLKSIRYMGFPQDAIIAAVLKNEVDAGIVRSGLLELIASEGHLKLEELRVLNANSQFDYPYRISSRLFPEWPFAVLPGTNKKLREDVLKSLLNTQSEKVSRKYKLRDIWSAPLSYDAVRSLIKSYNHRTSQNDRISENINYIYAFYAVLAILVSAGFLIAFMVVRRKNTISQPAETTESVIQDPELLEVRDKFETLTPREREILILVCNGQQTKKIAEELHISPKTVEYHRTNLLQKTEAGTTAHLVQLATRLGYDQGVSLG